MRAPGLSQLVPFVGCAAWRTGRGFSTGVPAAARDRRIRKIEKGLRCLDASIRSIDAEIDGEGLRGWGSAEAAGPARRCVGQNRSVIQREGTAGSTFRWTNSK